MPLDFVGTDQWIENRLTGERIAIPRTTVSEGTTPPNSTWAKNPIPGCNFCDPATKCHIDPNDAPLLPEPGLDNEWMDQILCTAKCASNQTKEERNNAWMAPNIASAGESCPEGFAQFPPPAPGISGYANVNATRFSYIVDLIRIPEDIRPGRYLLGWRWDCEESAQIWQNCADILIVDGKAEDDNTNTSDLSQMKTLEASGGAKRSFLRCVTAWIAFIYCLWCYLEDK